MKLPPALTADARELLLGMVGLRDGQIPYVRTLAASCGLTVERTRALLRQFDAAGWVTYGPLWNEDSGLIAGSSWWLTDKGLAAQQANALAAQQQIEMEGTPA